MAFAQIVDHLTEPFPTNATAHDVDMPATVDNGDLLLVHTAFDGGPTITDQAGWTRRNGRSSAARTVWLWARVADGTEGGTSVDFVSSVGEKAVAQTFRISASSWQGTLANGLEDLDNSGINANPNSAGLAPAWGAEDTLWLSLYGADDDDDASAAPPNYTNLVYVESDASGDSASSGSSRRELNAGSENPGSFTIAASEQWVGHTVAIRPSSAAGITIDASPATLTLAAQLATVIIGVLTAAATAVLTVSAQIATVVIGILTVAATAVLTVSAVAAQIVVGAWRRVWRHGHLHRKRNP